MDEPPFKDEPRDSSFKLEISIAIGYNRTRAVSGKWESGLTSVVLLIAGVVAVLLILYRLSVIQWPF